MEKKKRIVSKILPILIIIVGLVLCLIYLVGAFIAKWENDKGKSIFDDLKSPIILEENDGNDEQPEEGIEEESLAVYKDLIPQLREEYSNGDIVGYIDYPDAGIEYSIVQGKTNDEYLRKSPYKKYSQDGSIILDTDNDVRLMDSANIIYGHAMKSGTMFGKLQKHVKSVGLGEEFYVYTEKERITYKTIAYGVVDPSDRANFLQLGQTGYPEFLKHVSNTMDKYELCINDNRFVTLITCTYLSKTNKVRFGVVGAEIAREPYEKEESIIEDIIRIKK